MLDANKARDELKEILNTKEYQIYHNESKGLIETLWEKAKQWIAEQLLKLFPSMESAGSASGPILIVIIVVVVFFLAFAAIFMIRNHNRNKLLRNKKPLQSMNEINWSSERHLQEAKKQEGLAEYTLATRHLFLALLLNFHEKDWLEARIWKTNWEYYEELRKVNQQWAGKFNDLAALFDEVTYGKRKVQEKEYQLFQMEVGRMLEEYEQTLDRAEENT
ncbi:DUF4129 domain-containing protein [Neobacillus vireti]|uniref:Protein-glutamine gamma-glutamyltransferase-like C-terminal domain-containing protein n=1 Tax=Neobacillus vireti LMG 21834 TaxID=1131730 RepID=A0AB94IP41_9BACI|nr:DUF4129 domain-containing protein [Neobacillus vireti]ETI68871.1 hypothetical protein BAVI_08926 [Neobacillus vireti LMG 21834]KLT15813.1 hypothetical protein AA980_21620 [Neobacillus vireti]